MKISQSPYYTLDQGSVIFLIGLVEGIVIATPTLHLKDYIGIALTIIFVIWQWKN